MKHKTNQLFRNMISPFSFFFSYSFFLSRYLSLIPFFLLTSVFSLILCQSSFAGAAEDLGQVGSAESEAGQNQEKLLSSEAVEENVRGLGAWTEEEIRLIEKSGIEKLDLALLKKTTSTLNGYLKLPNGQILYVRYIPPKKGAETLVLLNGLTSNTKKWEILEYRLNRDQDKETENLGILEFDFRGQGLTHELSKNLRDPYIKDNKIPFLQQVEDLKYLIQALDQKPIIVGLSYGGGIGIAFAEHYPQMIKHLISMAPYTHALADQEMNFDAIIRTTNALRSLMGFEAIDYEKFKSALIKKDVFTSYGMYEPGNWDRLALTNLIEGIRHWDATKDPLLKNIPANSVTIVQGVLDQYVKVSDILDIQKALKESALGYDRYNPRWFRDNLVQILSEHKMPEKQGSPFASREVIKTVLRYHRYLEKYPYANPLQTWKMFRDEVKAEKVVQAENLYLPVKSNSNANSNNNLNSSNNSNRLVGGSLHPACRGIF